MVGRSKPSVPPQSGLSEGALVSSGNENPAEGGCLPWTEIRGRAGQRGQWLVIVFQSRTSKALRESQGTGWQAPGLVPRKPQRVPGRCEDLGADCVPALAEPYASWVLTMPSAPLCETACPQWCHPSRGFSLHLGRVPSLHPDFYIQPGMLS